MEKEYRVTQISTKCLSQFSYFIQSGGESVVIDPLRDFQEILDLLASSKTKLKYIILSHFHADYVAGHFDLQAQTGAKILLGPCSLLNENVDFFFCFFKCSIFEELFVLFFSKKSLQNLK